VTSQSKGGMRRWPNPRGGSTLLHEPCGVRLAASTEARLHGRSAPAIRIFTRESARYIQVRPCTSYRVPAGLRWGQPNGFVKAPTCTGTPAPFPRTGGNRHGPAGKVTV
jgi:hypothetical protein